MDRILNELGSWYAVRLSSFDELSLETTTLMLKGYQYILSEEGDGLTTKYHQHIVWVFEGTSDELRSIIKTVYPNCIGNKCMYVRASTDKKQLAKYTLKEGKYTYQGFTQQYIEDMFKTSIPKTNMKVDLTNNEDEYILKKIDLDEFVEKLIIIKSKYDQPLYMNHIEAYVRKMMVKRDSKNARKISHYIIEKIQN